MDDPKIDPADCGDVAHHPVAAAVRAAQHDKFTRMQLERAATLFSAVAEPGRLKIIALLLESEYCVGDLAQALDEEPSTISARLRLLRMHGLVKRRRDGKHLWYSLADAHVVDLMRSAIDHAAER
jgi:DNA-binding transcriptional ArsR family regulator